MTSPEATTGQTLRIIDANLNRIGEGLRLLEDLARLLLNDSTLTQQLKTMRHEILEGDLSFNQQLLQARNSEGDVGINIEAGQDKHKELPLVAVANARRVQEALRVIEELAKVPGIKLDSEKFKRARFDLYAIERTLLSKLLRQDKTRHVSGLYFIINAQGLNRRGSVELAHQAIAAGAKIIQLRDKRSKSELLPLARDLKNLCSEHDVLFIINEHLDLVLAVDADGLHIEQDSLPVKEARKLLPIDKILGCSVTTMKQAISAQSGGADYIAAGSIYPAAGEKEGKVIGLAALRQIRQALTLPIVANGGINKDNTTEVVAAGADAVAVTGTGQEGEIETLRQIAVQFEKSK